MPIALGTCGWSYPDWVGPVYSEGSQPRDWLPQYATMFDIVEADTTFYRIPSRSLVTRWNECTPPHFRFALKVPREITHDRCLVDVAAPLEAFLHALEPLGGRRAALLFQFPYFNKSAFKSVDEFLARLDPVLSMVGTEVRVAIEVRNRGWVARPLLDLARSRGAAVAMTAQPSMPGAEAWEALGGAQGLDFAYVRLLGDRKGIEALTTHWHETILDKSHELEGWRRLVQGISSASPDTDILVFANNHYAGHAPDTLRIIGGLPPEHLHLRA